MEWLVSFTWYFCSTHLCGQLLLNHLSFSNDLLKKFRNSRFVVNQAGYLTDRKNTPLILSPFSVASLIASKALDIKASCLAFFHPDARTPKKQFEIGEMNLLGDLP